MESGNDWKPLLDDLAERKAAATAQGGEEKLAKHHAKGKMDARARLDLLLDPGSFTELGVLVGTVPSDSLIAGVGAIDGRPVAVGAEDFTVMGGSIGNGTSAKRFRLAELARQERMPLLMLLEGAGHRPALPGDPAGTRSPNDLQAQAQLSGTVPIVTGVFGSSAGHGALTAPLSDFTVMAANAAIFTAGPPLVKASLGEEIDKHDLGGPQVALASGVIHNMAADDAGVLATMRQWLSFFPSNAWQRPPRRDNGDMEARTLTDLVDVIPRNPRQSYDMKNVLDRLVDESSWLEVQPSFGESILTGLAHLGGQPVAIVANQPAVRAGTIDAEAADKAAHFIQVADAFHLPLLFLTDNPGVMAGSASERAGILRHGARMFAAQTRAQTMKVQVTLRKAYGFGSSAMSMNPCDNQTLNLAFPGVTFGAMPSKGGDAATNSDAERSAALREAELASGYRSASGLSVDDLIDPRELRSMVLRGFAMAANRLAAPAEPVARIGTLP